MERLQNALASRGVASRRGAASLIIKGEVSVNGKVALEPGMRVNPLSDSIAVGGVALPGATERKRTVVIYKPRGIISSADNRHGETVCDLLRDEFSERLVPVGRLDKESEGLFLLSNDGDLILRMTHPRYGVTKTYIARVAGRLDDGKLALLRSRLEIDGYRINPVKVEVLRRGGDHTHKLAFTLSEGRNRQIRKMCSQARLVVLSLTRVSIGPLKICNLQPGQWRELSEEEVAVLERG